MAIINVKRMSVLALQKDKEEILRILQKLGNVEVVNLKEEMSNEDWTEVFGEVKEQQKSRDGIENKLNDIRFCLDFLSNYDKSKKPLFAEKPVYSEEEMKKAAEAESVSKTIETCRVLESRLNSLKSEKMKLHNTITALLPWQELDVDIQDINDTEKAAVQVGSFPTKNLEMVNKLLKEKAPESSLQQVSVERELTNVLLAYHKDRNNEVSEILKDFGWSKVELPKLQGSPRECIKKAEKRISEIETEQQQIIEEAKTLLRHKPELEIAYDYYTILKQRKDVFENTGKTNHSFYLEGWVSEQDMETVKSKLEKAVDGISISFRDPKDDEDVPTVVKNPKLVEPYELITELYSMPSRRDIDPNIFMAPFFFVFFGMMVSDAGYGIVMAVLAAVAMKMIKPKGMAKKLFGLIFLGGVSTFIWGAVFGGWFGDLIKLPPIWINPLSDPIRLLIFSFVLGIIQIYTGLFLQAYKNIRDGNTLNAIFDQGFWMVFLAGFILFAFPGMAQVAKTVVIVGAVGLVLTQGRHQKNPIMKVASGVLSLYDVTGYLSDVLSYSRVLALGLATGVIATVINTMGRLIGVNWLGYIFMAILLIGGHLFNIAINALGAYVHSSRLQYVEFFSKFYEGGGRAMLPFKINTKYTNLENGEEI